MSRIVRGDRQLASRVVKGEEAAFDDFFGRFFPRLYRFALARVEHDHDVAEEVVQATLIKAIDKLAGYRAEAPLFTWLCTFCRHEISAHFRREGRQPEPSLLNEDDPEIAAALDSLWAQSDAGPEADVRRREVARLVQVVLDRLPGRYGDALEWKYADGISVNEIAGRLSITPKAAESLLSRARSSFRDGFTSLVGGRAPYGALEGSK